MAPTLSPRMMMVLNTVSSSTSTSISDRKIQVVVITVCVVSYLIFGVITYALVNRCRLASLPDWYAASSRGKRETAMLGLWYPAVLLLWPLVLPPWILSRIGFDCCGLMGKACSGQRTPGTRGGTSRDGVDLERWEDIPLDEGESGMVMPGVRPADGREEDPDKIVWWRRHPLPEALSPQVSPRTPLRGNSREACKAVASSRGKVLSTITEDQEEWVEQSVRGGSDSSSGRGL